MPSGSWAALPQPPFIAHPANSTSKNLRRHARQPRREARFQVNTPSAGAPTTTPGIVGGAASTID